MTNKKIAITIGDPAGIGPEIILKALDYINNHDKKFLLIGNKEIFYREAAKTSTKLDNIEIIDITCDIENIHTGISSIESGKLSYLALEMACNLANQGKISAIATAPLSKKAINMAGYHYSGQTEILETLLKNKNNNQAEMFFVAGNFRVLLLTRHIPLSKIKESLTIERIISAIDALNKSLIKNFKINKPKIAICGLNPHAGEDGLLGAEEQEIIIPALNILRKEFNIDIEGPFPGDTLWLKARKPYFDKTDQPYDAYAACYHDQGLIPMKLLAMDYTVNTTINLSVIRTSPSHGTAYDIAGKNIANYNSMIEAIKLASNLAKD